MDSEQHNFGVLASGTGPVFMDPDPKGYILGR